MKLIIEYVDGQLTDEIIDVATKETDRLFGESELFVIDEGYGFSFVNDLYRFTIGSYKDSLIPIVILTNSTYILDSKEAWEDDKCNIYILNREFEKLYNITYLTNKSLRKAHNLEKMYRCGEFEIPSESNEIKERRNINKLKIGEIKDMRIKVEPFNVENPNEEMFFVEYTKLHSNSTDCLDYAFYSLKDALKFIKHHHKQRTKYYKQRYKANKFKWEKSRDKNKPFGVALTDYEPFISKDPYTFMYVPDEEFKVCYSFTMNVIEFQEYGFENYHIFKCHKEDKVKENKENEEIEEN